MAGVSWRFWPASDQVRPDIDRFLKRADDLTPVMKDFGEYMLLTTDDRFSAERAPDGSAWQPLTDATIAQKDRNADKILTEHENLRGSVIYSAGKKLMAYGTNKIYGAIHQLSGMAGRGKRVRIPARPYLGINEADLAEFYETARDHMES